MLRSGNPALKGEIFSRTYSGAGGGTMTLQGTVNKTFILLLLAALSAGFVWSNPGAMMVFTMPALIVGLILAVVPIFKKEWAGITAPFYALVEGVVIGGVSYFFEAQYPGIVIKAVALTFGTLFCLLIAYRSGLIKATENFKLGVIAGTGAVAIFYFISLILSFFGVRMTVIYGGGPVGILFSLVVVTIAALNLVLDFDFIETGVERKAPGFLEWYCAFSLIVTLIWLYFEILRLLSKLQRR
ncbi:MAG: hypothetical protein GF408_01860 [Candidatus Omnitrophica bacterium]|nr:hypothetical protein [Candidatus Omnitrophota bacterium]